MARILLLDDSPVMHRVVRMTFADDPSMDILVAKTPPEVEQILSAGAADLIIAYVRFAGAIDARYFEALNLLSPRILLLAESDENLDDLTRAGFLSVLRKPFHSDELRLTVEQMLAKSHSRVPVTGAAPARSAAPIPPSPPPTSTAPAPARATAPIPPSPPPTSAAPAPARSAAPIPPSPPPTSAAPAPARNAAPIPPSPPPTSAAPAPARSAAPIPPSAPPSLAQPAGQAAQPRKLSEDIDDTLDFSRPSGRASSVGAGTQKADAGGNASFFGEPQLTMDLSFFQKAVQQNQDLIPVAKAGVSESEEKHFPEEDFTITTWNKIQTERSGSSPGSAAVLSDEPEQRSVGRAVEPAAWSGEPMSIEDVMISTRMNSANLSKAEIEALVEQAVAAAVSKSVRQALNEILPDLRQALVNEVSQRAANQLSAELQAVRKSLRESILDEVRELSAQWLRRETPNLAKDVIREEIRRVIEGEV